MSMIRMTSISRRWPAAVSLALLLSWSSPISALPMGPFAGFAGQWQGLGSIVMSDGSRDSIRCKANYSVGGGDTLAIAVDCASDSYTVKLVSNVVARGKEFSGTWQETTRQVSGNVTGWMPAAGQMEASLEGMGFGIQLAASTNGKQQAVTIRSQGTDVQNVSITLRKA